MCESLFHKLAALERNLSGTSFLSLEDGGYKRDSILFFVFGLIKKFIICLDIEVYCKTKKNTRI